MIGEQSDVLTGNLVSNLSRSVKIIERQLAQLQEERLADLERQKQPITFDQVKELLEYYHQDLLKRLEKHELSVAQKLDEFSSAQSHQSNLATASPDAAQQEDTVSAETEVDKLLVDLQSYKWSSGSLMRPRLPSVRGLGLSYSRARRPVNSQRWSKASSGVWSECEDIDFSIEPNMSIRAGSFAHTALGDKQLVTSETQKGAASIKADVASAARENAFVHVIWAKDDLVTAIKDYISLRDN